MKFFTFAILFFVSSCSSTTTSPKQSEATKVVAQKESSTPQLWTFQKELNGDVDVCAVKAESILKLHGFSSISKSVYEQQTYFYANFVNNRAGIHCTSIAGKTFVYGAIAGSDAKAVEGLRNSIAWKF